LLLVGLDRDPLVVLRDLEGLHGHCPFVRSEHRPELVACHQINVTVMAHMDEEFHQNMN